MGDSLSVGTMPLLVKRYEGDKRWLVSGRVKGGMQVPWMTAQLDDLAKLAPLVVLVMGGTNDLASGVTPSATVERMATLVARARALGLPIVVGTIPPTGAGVAWRDKVTAYNAELSARLGSVVADVSGEVQPSDLSPDGVHLRSYAKLADGWTTVLQQLGASFDQAEQQEVVGTNDGWILPALALLAVVLVMRRS